MSPKIVEIIEKLPQNPQKISQQKKTLEYGYQVLVKKSKHKMVGVPPCISCFVGARILGRVWMPAFTKTIVLKNWGAFSPVFHVFLVLEI